MPWVASCLDLRSSSSSIEVSSVQHLLRFSRVRRRVVHIEARNWAVILPRSSCCRRQSASRSVAPARSSCWAGCSPITSSTLWPGLTGPSLSTIGRSWLWLNTCCWIVAMCCGRSSVITCCTTVSGIFGAFHQHHRLRGVLGGECVGDQKSRQWREQRRNQNHFHPAAQHRQIIVHR